MGYVVELPTNQVLEQRIEELTLALGQLVATLHARGALDREAIDETVHGAEARCGGPAFLLETAPSIECFLRENARVYLELRDTRKTILANAARERASNYKELRECTTKERVDRRTRQWADFDRIFAKTRAASE